MKVVVGDALKLLFFYGLAGLFPFNSQFFTIIISYKEK
jgi:hypothetical protein